MGDLFSGSNSVGNFMSSFGTGFVNGMQGSNGFGSPSVGNGRPDPLTQLWNNISGQTGRNISADANMSANAWATPVSAPPTVNGVSNYTFGMDNALNPIPNIDIEE